MVSLKGTQIGEFKHTTESAISIANQQEQNVILEAAFCFAEMGVSIIPVFSALHPDESKRKKPSLKWNPYQKRIASDEEIKKFFLNGAHIAAVTGTVSGNLEIIDFDEPKLFNPYMDVLKGNDSLLANRVLTATTPSGGYHLIFRCEEKVPGNTRLARSKDGKTTLIETRGQGGYFLLAPSAGYRLKDSFEKLQIISKKERDLLIWIAESFCEYQYSKNWPNEKKVNQSGDRPGDIFNKIANWYQLLEADGWSFVKTVSDREHWTRPGKKHGSTSATLNDKGLYVFSSSTSLPTQEPIDKFGYLVKFRFNGDCSAAARWIVGKYPKFFQYDNDFQSIQPTSASLATASQVSAKSQSNFSQTEIMSRRISEEVVAFIDSDPAPFKNKDLYSELYVNSQAERKAVRNALLYQEKIGKISRIEGERGSWEVVEDTPEKMNLLSTDTKPFNLLLPLGISEHVVVRPGAVVLVAGASNAGKTAFLLRTVRNHLAEFLKSPHMQTPSDPPFINKREGGLPEIRYLNSEMSANELVARIECFGDEPAQWNKYVNFYERNHSFHRLVAPEGINFVDYLELPDEFYLANKYISEIHQSLTTGVAVVAMQKKQDQNYAFGGEMTLQKPRLVINLDNNDPHGFTCKIAKLKEPKDFTNKIQGKVLDYHITRDTQLVAHSGWRFVNKSQRQAINIEYDQQIIKAIMPQ